MMCQYIRKAFSLYYARLILKGAIQTNQNIFSKNRVSLKSVADTETASENHGAEGAFYYAIDGFVGDLIAKRKYLVGWKQFWHAVALIIAMSVGGSGRYTSIDTERGLFVKGESDLTRKRKVGKLFFSDRSMSFRVDQVSPQGVVS